MVRWWRRQNEELSFVPIRASIQWNSSPAWVGWFHERHKTSGVRRWPTRPQFALHPSGSNRHFKKHCLAYEQNAWKKAFRAVEWSWSVLSTVANASFNFEVKPLRSAATRATSSIESYIESYIVLFFFFFFAKISTSPDYSPFLGNLL